VKLLDSIPLLLELLVQYFKLKNKLAVYDVVERFDSRMDALDRKRETLRKIPNAEAQDQASRLVSEIVEEKEKFKIFLEDLNKK
jgi:hypothetical protein